ncbi:MAG TPA: hypothetical protein VHV83_18850, partial [Armatimonadota bacterium]|nr:hypothetical protein [Armatimonadota bacterium]
FGNLNFEGWRYLSVRLDQPDNVSHWGGTGTPGKMVLPIRIDTFILVDGVKNTATKGEADFANFHLIFTE